MPPAPPPVPARWAYVGTTGVYGDRGGDLTDERTPLSPQSDRARRRVAAERRLRDASVQGAIRLSILRAPGIYAADRLPVERIAKGLPAIEAAEDGWTNHIHAEDLARAVMLALLRGPNGRAFDAVDRSDMKMGDWFDAVADARGLPRPPRLPREAVRQAVPPATWSFMRESRRIRGERIGRELRLRLRYPTVRDGLADARTPRG